MITKNHNMPTDILKVLYENRYCNQEGFSILVCGGKDKNCKDTNQVLELKVPSFEVTEFPFMAKPHSFQRLATINSEIFAIVDNKRVYRQLGSSCSSVEIYSEKSRTWKHQYINFEERFGYCICSLMSKLYLVGGWIESSDTNLSSCYSYDTNSKNWNKIAELNKARGFAACTVFEGKIVVTG